MSQRAAEIFLQATKYENLGPSDQQRGIDQPPLHSVLRDGPRLDLPRPEGLQLGSMELFEAIGTRRSLRTYSQTPLSLDELSYLLWSTQGVKAESTSKFTLRTVPSAGARHAFETIVLVHRVAGLKVGLYQYDAANHGLIAWETPDDITNRFMAACLDQRIIAQSAVTFIWVAERERMAWRYGERGLRYLLLDAGHACQNLYLASESIAAGACAVGAYNDDAVNQLLELDGKSRFAVYLATVGKRELQQS